MKGSRNKLEKSLCFLCDYGAWFIALTFMLLIGFLTRNLWLPPSSPTHPPLIPATQQIPRNTPSQRSTVNPSPTRISSPSPFPSPITTDTPLTHFSDPQSLYTIEYPSQWQIETFDPQTSQWKTTENSTILIYTEPVLPGETLENFANKIVYEMGYTVKRQNMAEIGGETAIRQEIALSETNPLSAVGYITFHNGVKYQIGIAGLEQLSQEEANQLIQTFEILIENFQFQSPTSFFQRPIASSNVLADSAIPKNMINTNSCCPANWKLPLSAGEWKITQGDKDSCVSTHCLPTHPINQYALDIVSKHGTTLRSPILAPADGTVYKKFTDPYGGGKVLKIEHGNGGPVSIYLHLDGYVEGLVEDQPIKQGEVVAYIGNTGHSTNPHLHLTVYPGTQAQSGLKITEWDGNTVFTTGSTILSTNNSSVVASPEALQKPQLSSPAPYQTFSQQTPIILQWQAVPNATEYKVELWGPPYDLMTPCNWQTQTSCFIGQMAPGTFSWHVRARNSNAQSEWSETLQFSIITNTFTATLTNPTSTITPIPTSTQYNPPQPPVLISPANNYSYPENTNVSMIWNSSPSAYQYYLEYWGGPYSTLTSGWISATSFHIGSMWPGNYFWHVKARDINLLESSWSETRTFSVVAATISPTKTPTPRLTNTPTATQIPQPGFVELVDELSLRTEAGNWPPQNGQKLIAHIKIRNGGDLPIHIEHIGVRGRRNNSEFWDIGFWTVDLNGDNEWELNPNNERPLQSGNYSFRISYSLNGSTWIEIGNEINFTVP